MKTEKILQGREKLILKGPRYKETELRRRKINEHRNKEILHKKLVKENNEPKIFNND